MTRVLLLGGTSEANQLARRLAAEGIDAVYSYAGRTEAPVAQPLPTRHGGFGGVKGLVRYLSAEAITHVVDATHPFAAVMSQNAVTACDKTGLPLCVFERPAWQPGPDDRWTFVPDIAAAIEALPASPACVFLAIGRQTISAFAEKPQHHYLLRLVDQPKEPLPLPDSEVVIARGPFGVEADTALLTAHQIDLVVAKNSGGDGARAKLDAARMLGLPVILIDRPRLPDRHVARDIAEIMAFLGHPADLGV